MNNMLHVVASYGVCSEFVSDDDYFNLFLALYENIEILKLYGGGTVNKVYMLSDKLLGPHKAHEIIENQDESKVLFVPPTKYKGDKVYVTVVMFIKLRIGVWVNRTGQGLTTPFGNLTTAGDRKGDTSFTKNVYFFKETGNGIMLLFTSRKTSLCLFLTSWIKCCKYLMKGHVHRL